MTYVALHFFLALLVELPIMRATYRILRMRSVGLFIALHLALFCFGFFIKYLPFSKIVIGLLSFVTSIAMLIVLPFGLSTGTVRSRLVRICLICLGAIVTEYVGGSTYSFISGGQIFPSELNRETIGSVVTVFSLLIVLSIAVNEALIMLCGYLDHERDVTMEPPVIVLPLVTYLFLNLLYVRRHAMELHEATIPVLLLACSVITLAICAGLIFVARREAMAARKATDNAAMARQERHVRGEIEASVRRTTEMSRLRHDLANQVEVVEGLAAQGRFADADQYLARLQLQAQTLMGEEQ